VVEAKVLTDWLWHSKNILTVGNFSQDFGGQPVGEGGHPLGVERFGIPGGNLTTAGVASFCGETRGQGEIFDAIVADLRAGRRFEDAMARGVYSLDGYKPDDDKRAYNLHKEALRVPPYQIPLRSLIAQDAKNLLMAGRCFSSDQLDLSQSGSNLKSLRQEIDRLPEKETVTT